MKKWIIRISLSLFAILLLIAGILFFLLGTQSGTNFIVTQAVKLMDGQLKVDSATGTLLDRLELYNLFFESREAGKAEITKLILDWKSSDLFNLHIHLIELSASGISYTASVLETEENPKSESIAPFSLPDLALPVTITIENIAADTISFYSSADAEPVTISHVKLSAFWDTKGIQLHNLSLSMPELAAEAKGKILPTGTYPLTFVTEIKTLSPEYPSVSLHGNYGGDLQNLTIDGILRGDLEMDIHGTLQDIVNGLAWDINLSKINFAPKIFSPDIPGTVSGTISSTGTLKSLHTSAQIAIRDKDESNLNWDAVLDIDINLDSLFININQCNLNHLNSPAVIDLVGTADIEQQLDIALNWKKLQWPITGSAGYSSPVGNAKLTGTIDDYSLILNTTVAGTQIPDADIRLSSNGNTKSANNIELSIKTLEGTINVDGSAEWTPAVKWQVKTRADKLNPGIQYPQWPGTISWLLKSDGHVDESGVFADVSISSLQGVLRDLPIAGSGNVTIAPENIRIDKFWLLSGYTKLTAQGLLGDASDLKWDIHIADFSDLLPESSGQLNATGTVLGRMTAPQITANLSGTSIVIPQAEIEGIQLKTDIDLSWHEPFTIDLAINNLQSGENLLPKVTLKANGKSAKHRLNLFASHKLATLSLALEGAYDKELWNGVLSSLTLDSNDLGTWQTNKSTKIVAASESAKIEQLCISREESDLCLSGNWDAKNSATGAAVSLTEFPLNWISAWFPDALENLGGIFSLDAEINMQDKLQATAHAQITPGVIHYTTLKDTRTLYHEGMKLDLQIADDGVNANLWLSLESNIISGNLQSPDLLRKSDTYSPALDGKIKIDASNFRIAETLVDDIENLKAQIDTNFTIKGTLAQPEVNGAGKLHINNILIPAAGLELSDTSLNILAHNSELKINGVFNSGKGSMALDGIAFLNAEKNYPAHITLKGDNFRLVNLPDIQVYLSSDLAFEKTKDLTLLSGTVTIPKADILLRTLPKGTVTASPDIVIIQEEKEATDTKSPMTMDLKVSLGKKVYFAGLGVAAFIDGQLQISAEPDEQMFGSGEFHIRQGSYRAYGQDLEIEKGVISFPGGPLTQPGINLRATRSVGDVVAGISAIGPAKKPRITTFSEPPMSESQTLSYIITGASPSTGGAKLSVGRQINNKLSVSVGTDTKTGDSQFVARYRLSRKLNMETTTGTSSNAIDLYYTTEFEENPTPQKGP